MDYTDETLMPFGKYQGKKMADVPASYLIWLRENVNRKDLNADLRLYIDDNMQALKAEVKREGPC